MKNYQRVSFLIFSTIIILAVFITYKTTQINLSSGSGTSTSAAYTMETKILIENELAQEYRDVEDDAEKKQEIVTEVKSEYEYSVTEEEIIMLAQVIYSEAGGLPSVTEQSCVAWTVLNRVDMDCYPDSIAECITQPCQFAYYSSTKVTDHCLWLARDVVSRWELERSGKTNVGRTLPKGYISFWGDGAHNYFRVSCDSCDYWDYSYESPYNS